MIVINMSVVVNVAIIITPILIAVGFVFAYRQWEATRATRTAEVVIQLSTHWDSRELKKSRQKVKENAERLKQAIEEAHANNSEDLFDLVQVGNFFDTLGVLVTEGFLTRRIAYDLLSGPEESYYKMYKSILEDPKYKNNYKYFIQLHEAFKNEEAERSKIPRTPRRAV